MTTASSASAPARPIFDPVDTGFDPNDVTGRDDVESPSLSSSNALARFEFEPGKSRDGTKVLMVEWEDDDVTSALQGDWEIRWEGKKTVLPAREQQSARRRRDATAGEEDVPPVNRLYFLLGPGVNIPTTVKLRKGSVSWKTNPLPAIFSPELGATARQAGKKGVLHTIWAKKRLQVLQREIENETKNNFEGIGLEMALAEKEWIEANFGVVTRPSSVGIPQGPLSATSPVSPRSPGGGRLMDKLKGLRLGTGAEDLSPNGSRRNGSVGEQAQHNPLSPETSDVAIGGFSSFAAIKGMPNPSTLAAKPAQRPESVNRPPSRKQQVGSDSRNAKTNRSSAEDGKQDDLFALPMSPKSATTTSKNPFSFKAQDTSRYTQQSGKA